MNPTLVDLAERFWDLRLETMPSIAPLEDDFRFVARIEDWSRAAELTTRARLVALSRRLAALDRNELSAGESVTAHLLEAELDDEIEAIDLRTIELASDQMTGPHAMYLQIPPQVAYPDGDSATESLDGLRLMSDALESLMDRFVEGGEAGRSSARLCIDRSLQQIDGYLASEPSDDVFTTVTAPVDWDGLGAWRDALSATVLSHVRPAFARFRDRMVDQLAPIARDDEHAGLCHLDDGADLYRAAIRRHTSLELGPDEIHRVGLDEIESLRDEYRRIGSEVFATDDLDVIFDRLRTDPEYRYDDRDEILADAKDNLGRAEAAMGDWFGRLPDSQCEIEPVPEFMEEAMPPAYYWPPSPDGTRAGTYYVNTHQPEEQSRAEAQSIAFHEAIPGHHLQIAIATELPDLPMFQRRSTAHTAYVEGWGLYAERLADEMGLYSSGIDRLGMLVADSWRAARLVVDTGIHDQGWSRAEAVDWVITHTPVAPETVAVEIDRYIAMPGQALAYKLGQRELMRLRSDATRALGERFDIRAFHDVVLGSGTVSLPILADLVGNYIESAAPA